MPCALARCCSTYSQAPQQLISKQQPSAAGPTPAEPLGSFCEFPAINPAHRSQAYRYSYCLSAVRPTNIGNALSKMDLQQGSAQTWHEPGGAVGELQCAGWWDVMPRLLAGYRTSFQGMQMACVHVCSADFYSLDPSSRHARLQLLVNLVPP
jgi:hypothetical protein